MNLPRSLTVTVLAGLGAVFTAFTQAADPPNILILFADDAGYADSQSSHTGPVLETDTVHPQSDTNFDQATFAWSADGETWHSTKYTYQLRFGTWRGNRPGLFCWNLKTDDLEKAGYVDIDWFRYTPSPR